MFFRALACTVSSKITSLLVVCVCRDSISSASRIYRSLTQMCVVSAFRCARCIQQVTNASSAQEQMISKCRLQTSPQACAQTKQLNNYQQKNVQDTTSLNPNTYKVHSAILFGACVDKINILGLEQTNRIF